MTAALRVLTALFDVDSSGAQTKIKALNAQVTNMKGALGTLATTFVGAFSVRAFAGFLSGQIAIGSQVRDTAEKLGVSTEALQKFTYASEQYGVSAEGAATGLQFLNKNIGEAIGGGAEQAKVFAQLGIDLADVKKGTKSATDLLPQLADKFAGLGSDAERTALSMKIFGRSGTSLLPLLNKGSKEVEAMFSSFDALGGGIEDDFINAAHAAGDEITNLKLAFNGLKSRIAIAILPTVTEFVKKLEKVVVAARVMAKETNVVKDALAALGIVGAAAGIKTAASWAKFLGIVPKDAGLLKTALGLGEILLVVAGVALLALAFEDFFTFLRGGESVVGDLIEEFLGFGKANEFLDQLRASWELISGLFATDLESLAPLVDLFKDLASQVLPYVVAGFVDIVRVVAGLVVTFAAFVKGFSQLTQLDFKGLGKTLDATGKTLFGDKGLLATSSTGELAIKNKKRAQAAEEGARFGTDVKEVARYNPDALQPYVPPQTVAVAPSVSNVRGDTTVSPTYQTTIHVQGAATNEETGRRLERSLRKFGDDNAATLAALQTGAPDR
jgi:hypothetical protein